jgi:hypothetical protein
VGSAVIALDPWERYTRWNRAVADVVFPPSAAGQPVYLDLEDDALGQIRDLADPQGEDPASGLVEAVRGTLRVDVGASEVFRSHLSRLTAWEQGDWYDPPPSLALLAVLSLAAENMHEGEGQASHNFYGRLAELLKLDEYQKDRFTNAYRMRLPDGTAVSEKLWESLTMWLEILEGSRGLPTAFADAHPHIGLALSQALVRRTDRERLTDLFEVYGLAPQSSLPAAEMADLIGEWLSRIPCPASNSFERIWRRDAAARERIVEVAQLALESWTGPQDLSTASGDHLRTVDSVRVLALLRRFPHRELELSLAIPWRTNGEVESLALLGTDDKEIGTLDFASSTPGWLVLERSSVETDSFMRGEVRLRKADQQVTLRRRPRRLVPLRFDQVTQAFIECERVSLGEEFLVLARKEISGHVDDVLTNAARPGYVMHDDLPGMPDGWALFEGVQVLSSIPENLLSGRLVDLNLLQPIASTQSVLEGGLQLPGNIRKWSSGRAPELRVTVDEAANVVATLRCVRPLSEPVPTERSRTSAQPVLIWNLQREHLPDGDYEIDLAAGGRPLGRPLSLRLRSADSPAFVNPAEDLHLAHSADSALFGLCADRVQGSNGFTCVPDGSDQTPAERTLGTTTPGWYGARRTESATVARATMLVVPAPDDKSCMVTGGHHMMIETALRGMTSVEGTCRDCGLVKRYPTRGRGKRRAKNAAARAATAPNVSVAELEAVPEHLSVDWDLGFDALCHMGQGPISALNRVAMQMESSEIFGDAFVRRLEVLGHIEVERDRGNLVATSWKVADPTILGLAAGECILAGFRSERMIVALEDAAYELGIEFRVDRGISAPPRVSVMTSGADDVRVLIEAIEASTGRASRYVANASYALAGCLPSLSELVEHLPTTSTISARSFERWNPTVARFGPALDTGTPGAYRLNAFGRKYIYRRPSQMGEMSAVIGDARLVKYAAALDVGDSLVGYDVDAQVLYVPLGADLPGLYGRAAVLSSGRPPRENLPERLLEYRKVPAHVAAHLSQLLMS